MDLIGELLRSSLLKELGDDKDRVGYVRGAAKDLAAEFSGKSRAVVPHAILAGIDEATPASVASLVAAEHALLGRWETYFNAFPGKPVEIIRAVTLAAVADVVASDRLLRYAAWYSMRNAVECVPAGRWIGPISHLVESWDNALSIDIAAIWSPTQKASSKLRMPTIPRADQITDPAGAIAQEAHKHSNAQLREYSSALGTRLRETLAAHEQTIEAVRLQSALLWWHQTAFSSRLRCGYDELSHADVVIAAAVDLHDVVPEIAPLAVEHLLANLVHNVTCAADVTIVALSRAGEAQTLPDPAAVGPATLIDAVRGEATTPLAQRDQAIPAGRAAILLFRDLQARRLASAEPLEETRGPE